MTDAEFEALVGRLETSSQSNPRAYRARVLLLAVFGNAYLTLVLLLLIGLLGACVASIAILKFGGVKLTVVVAAFVWMVLKALWVRIDAPTGTRVTPVQAPQLFAMIQELRAALGAPRFHRVLITDDFNAGVQQTPRLG